jgi:hypothetical protein
MSITGRLSLARYLDMLHQDSSVYEDLARHNAITARWEGPPALPASLEVSHLATAGPLLPRAAPNLEVNLNREELSPATRQWLAEHEPRSCRDVIDLWLKAQVVADGPKVFRPSYEQCQALEQVEPRIPLADYAQPYPVMVVEFPEQYRRRRTCEAESPFHTGPHAPEGVLVGFQATSVTTIWLDVFFSSGVKTRLALLPSDATIEAGIRREFGDDSFIDNGLTPDERHVLAGVLRIAVNAMLLLTEYGCKRRGPANPSYHGRLERYLRLARKRGHGVVEAERNLRLAAQVYGFAQDITLYERTHALAEGEGAGGPGRRPHWRRGHWKMQAHGPGLTLRRRRLIKPVFVNAHLVCDGQRSVPATYRIR